MPELPEVETVRRGLSEWVVGRRVASVEVTGRRSVRRQAPEELVAALSGRLLSSAGRWGKYLLVGLDDGAVLVVHLRMSGQLLLVGEPSTVPLPAHTHVRLVLEDGGELRFVDPRTFGELFVTEELDGAGRPLALGRLGPDPLLEGVDPDRLSALAGRRRTSLKAFLLDQSVLAGIGNLYADEICFQARVRPGRRTSSLRRSELRRLAEAIPGVLAEAVAARGSTLRDARYLDLMGSAGDYQLRHAVYGRTGLPCPSCGREVVREKVAGRSAHYCRACQR